MKKVLIMACFGISVGLFAQAPSQNKGQQALETAKNINFKALANILAQSRELLKIIPDQKARATVAKIVEPTIKVSELIYSMDKIVRDIDAVLKTGKEFPNLFTCLKYTKSQVAQLEKAIPTYTGAKKDAAEKQLAFCRAKCLNKPACIKEGIGMVEIMLRPILEDVLLGWTETDGKKQEGILLTILDLVQQPQIKAQIGTAVADMRKVIEFIDELKNLVKAA